MLASSTTKLDVLNLLERRVGRKGFGDRNPGSIPELVFVKAAKSERREGNGCMMRMSAFLGWVPIDKR